MKEQFRVAQKIGLMFRPEDEIPDDIHSWAVQQLYLKTKPMGIATKHGEFGPSYIEPWPDNLILSLSDGATKAGAMHVERKAIKRDKSLSKKQRKEKIKLLKYKYMSNWFDTLKFAHRNVYGADQVKQRFTLFWLNHFTVGPQRGNKYIMGHYIEKAIYNNLNGSFDELLYKCISHPTMLSYLDNIFNVGENSKKVKDCKDAGRIEDCGRASGLNDNLARELMELHTVSVNAGYTESDIRSSAKILSGWGVGLFSTGITVEDRWDAYIKDRAEPSGEVIVMGKKISLGKGAFRQLTDYLASLDETAEFLSKKLCQHFVSDNPSEKDIVYVKSKWIASNGDLNQIHSAVIERAIISKGDKFQWPITWLFQIIRLSGATFFRGWEEVNNYNKRYNSISAQHIFRELGQYFWSNRQPDGYSSHKSEWLSGEHFERRLRFADSVYNLGNPKLTAEEIMNRMGVSNNTRDLVGGVSGDRRKFVALMCSPELMGATRG